MILDWTSGAFYQQQRYAPFLALNWSAAATAPAPTNPTRGEPWVEPYRGLVWQEPARGLVWSDPG